MENSRSLARKILGPLLSAALSLSVSGASAALWNSTPNLSQGLGFYSLDEKWVPAAVKQAALSVFKVRVASISEAGQFSDFKLSSKANRAAAEQDIAQRPVSERFDELDRIMAQRQLKSCEESGKSHCFIPKYRIQGTAFLAGDGSTLWTNAHVIESYLNVVSATQGIELNKQLNSKEDIRIFVFDSENQLVVDPYAEPVRIKMLPQLSEMAKRATNFYYNDSDYLALQLSRPIGEALRLAATVPKPGEKTYVVGFPHCTGCDASDLNLPSEELMEFADRAPKPNAQGQNLQVTVGSVVDFEKILQPFFEMTHDDFKYWNIDKMLYTSADSTIESSGSPILNAQGEILAILSEVRTKKIHGYLQHVTSGVILPALN
jgi:hypothetical protein